MEKEAQIFQDILEQEEDSSKDGNGEEIKPNEAIIGPEGENGLKDVQNHKDIETNEQNGNKTEEINMGEGVEKESEKNQSTKGKSHCDDNRKFTIVHDEGTTTDDETSTTECDFSVMLLRGTIGELERALRDSRVLLKTRDEEIGELRKEVEKGRDQIHKEQMKWQRKSAAGEERGREIQELKRKLYDSEKANEELQERIKEFELPCSEADEVFACCASMKELIELKMELAKKDERLADIRKNNRGDSLEMEKALVAKDGWKTDVTSRTMNGEIQGGCERNDELKLKFLRDAFFYFMIDFHSEEQIKAILAVLAYGDQRERVILHAYHMRQRGKKFTVKEVSSRGLSFLHEEI